MTTLHRIRPAYNERRFYALQIIPDLFGEVLLLRNWGRIGTGGYLRLDPYPTAQEATQALAALVKAKTKRHYRPA